MQNTLVVLKPDAVKRRLVGTILARLETKGLRLAALKLVRVSDAQAHEMYDVHKGKDFHGPLLEFMTAGAVVAVVVRGIGAIDVVRKMIGSTFGPEAAPGTIRGDFGLSHRYNLIHASDSPESAAREIPVFFRDEEILDEHAGDEEWVYASIDRTDQ